MRKFKKITKEHDEFGKERDEMEKSFEQTRVALEVSHEEALTREMEALTREANDKLVIERSKHEAHVVQLSRQLQLAEARLEKRIAGSSPCPPDPSTPFSPVATPLVAPTPLSATTAVAQNTSPSLATPADVVATNSLSLPLGPSLPYEYIDALDATPAIIYKEQTRTMNYIVDNDNPEHGHLQQLADRPFISKWPSDWTTKLSAMKRLNAEGLDDVTRMFHCMKMYGLGKTSKGLFIVRDHRSLGEPFIFWTHYLDKQDRGGGKPNWQREEGTTRHEPGRVIKHPESLRVRNKNIELYEHGLVPPKASPNVFKDVLHECMRIAGVAEHSELVAALTKYKHDEHKINNVVVIRKELDDTQRLLWQTQQKLNEARAEAARTIPGIGLLQGQGKHKPGRRQRKRARTASESASMLSAGIGHGAESSMCASQGLLKPVDE